MSAKRDIAPHIGRRFGRWTLLGEAPPLKNRRVLCRCDCGVERAVGITDLFGGRSRACRACCMIAHGHATVAARSAEYRAWSSMRSRCTKPMNDRYPRYGGRGIRIAPEWLGRGGFARFLAHVGPRPSPQHSLDRVDNDGNYEPGNVRWATRREQYANRRNTVRLTLNGRTQCISDWCHELGITRALLLRRVRLGRPLLAARDLEPSHTPAVRATA